MRFAWNHQVGIILRTGVLLLVAGLLLCPSNAAAQHRHVSQLPASSRPARVAPGPEVFENVSRRPGVVEVNLVATPAVIDLVPGAPSAAYAYNGRVPGPRLELREGDQVTVHFRNELPDTTTVHWHGLHLPVTSDGSPFHPVAPGGEYTFEFTVRPGSAGTYWYHPHPHHRTGVQVAKGLYGAVIVRAADDPIAHLPEKLLILSDNRIRDDGSVDLPDRLTPSWRIDQENGREGDLLFVNGEVGPTLTIRSGEIQRWRIINASAARMYRLALPGHTFLHVGSDGGLFERPVERDEILITGAERVEVLVSGSGAPGSETALQALPYDRYIPQTRPADWESTRVLATLRYSNDPPMVPPPVPDRLRPIPELDTLDATATRVMVLTQGMINGRMMDMERVDVEASLGATEIWQVENLVGMDHPFHLHGFQFQVIDRNGVPEPFRSWKDVVNVPEHETVRFIVRYDDYPGKWMFHCHILDHEDHGMMGVLEVR